MPDVPSGARAPRHSTRHWDITVENVHFCTCYLFAVHSGTMHSDFGSDEGPFTLAFFFFPPRLVARDGSQPVVKKWMKNPISFFFCFLYMCCIVKSNHASLIAVHWQTPYSAFKFLFFSLPPYPYPQLASVFSCAGQLVFLTFVT